MQDEDRPLFRLEPPEPPFEDVAIRHVPALVADDRGRHRLELDLDGAPSTPSHDVEGGVDGQAMEPGVVTIRVAQTWEVAPGSDVRILDRVSRELGVPKDETSDGFQPGDGGVDELREGVMIAPPRLFDEFPLVHSRPR